MEGLVISWPMLIVVGLSLRMAVRLTYGARGPDADDPIYVMLNIMGWVFIGLGLLPALAVGIGSVFGGILIVLAVLTGMEIILQRRVAQRRSMCTLLSLMIERRAEIDSSVVLTGQSFRGIVGRSAKRLFAALGSGVPLKAAVARNQAALPAEASAYLAAGRTVEGQSAALRELSSSERGELATVWRACVDRFSYLLIVLSFMAGVMTFLMIKIVPEFEQIFSEFGLDLPLMSQMTVAISTWFTTYVAVPIIMLALVSIVAAIVIGIGYLCDVPMLAWLGDVFFRGRRKAHVLRILALAVEQREPMAELLVRIGTLFPSGMIRRKSRAAARMAAAGVDWREALCRARAITAEEFRLLLTAERVGNLPWSLRIIADQYKKRSVFRLTAILNVLYPLVILGLGMAVGFFVISLFMPIVFLIHGLSK